MFSKKKLHVQIQKISGKLTPFSGTYDFVDLPIDVKINKVTLPAGYSATINIYGVSKQMMNSITTICWRTGFIDQIAVRVFADDGDGEHLLFEGSIMSAIPNYSSAPDVYISINACAGAYNNFVTDVPPSSISEGKEVPVRQVFLEICKQYKVTLVDRGVKGTCTFPRIDGNGLAERISKAARTYNVNFFIENNSVTIYPKGSWDYKVKNDLVWTKDDYVGYPSFSNTGIEVKLDRVLFALTLGDFFTIKDSEIEVANDKWFVVKIEYDLSTKIGGKWEMKVDGVRVGIEKMKGFANG